VQIYIQHDSILNNYPIQKLGFPLNIRIRRTLKEAQMELYIVYYPIWKLQFQAQYLITITMSITSAGDQLQYNYNGSGEPITMNYNNYNG
jgi:hypothetical protein